jgi:hypothetical protein
MPHTSKPEFADVDLLRSHKWLLGFVKEEILNIDELCISGQNAKKMIRYAELAQSQEPVLANKKRAASVCLKACEGLDIETLDRDSVKFKGLIDTQLENMALREVLAKIRPLIESPNDQFIGDFAAALALIDGAIN